MIHDSTGQAVFKTAENAGEPVITGFHLTEIYDKLRSYGFKEIDFQTPWDFNFDYFQGRTDGLAPWEHIYVVRARL